MNAMAVPGSRIVRALLDPLILLAAFALTPAAGAGGYGEAKVNNGGHVRGRVAIGSVEPQVRYFTVLKDREVCGDAVREVPLVRAFGSALLDAVVYLPNVDKGKPFPAANRKVTINQQNCTFTPYLSVLANDGEMEVINSDPVLHNIHVSELIGTARRTIMNVSQPEKGNILSKSISLQRGAGMRLICAAHNFMLGFVFVAHNPYYAVVNHLGEFEITDVPPGTYVIKAWHGVLGEREGVVTIPPNGTVTIELSF